MERMPADTPAHLGCCGVASVAMLANIDFSAAWETMRRLKRSPGNWKGSTRLNERHTALSNLGVQYTTTHVGGAMTLNQWVRTKAEGDVVYEVQTRGHAQVVCNGLVYDQANQEGTPVAQFWGRRKRVQMVTKALNRKPMNAAQPKKAGSARPKAHHKDVIPAGLYHELRKALGAYKSKCAALRAVAAAAQADGEAQAVFVATAQELGINPTTARRQWGEAAK